MPKLVWDQTNERRYETGIEQVALYKQEAGAYPKGVAWNGLTAVTESPSGAEPTPLYADDIKYLKSITIDDVLKRLSLLDNEKTVLSVINPLSEG